jgi:hypothetical protein
MNENISTTNIGFPAVNKPLIKAPSKARVSIIAGIRFVIMDFFPIDIFL